MSTPNGYVCHFRACVWKVWPAWLEIISILVVVAAVAFGIPRIKWLLGNEVGMRMPSV
ncbi:MAG: hypothetical protein WBD56_01400 [Anaerolineales bacterium]